MSGAPTQRRGYSGAKTGDVRNLNYFFFASPGR